HFSPYLFEFQITRSSAFCAGAMACGERRSLIEKKQFRIMSSVENLTSSILERKLTSYPCLMLPGSDDFFMLVVENAAIAEPCAPRIHGN
ncbi:MAG: hypothetical protein ACI9MF_001729, partial [Gammaproteobacteria bacterium]